jgi:hypothetical protein
MKFRLVLCFAVLMVCLPIYGCNMPGPQARVGQIGGAQTWMDAPLDGSIIPFVPYEIVLHAYDPASVIQVELYANGNLLTTLPNPNPGQLLTTLKYLWSPAAPGNYTLSARAQSSGGVWGSEATVMVTVVGSTATPVITVTDVITVTTTTTMTSTPTNTPTTVPAELSFTPRISTNQFYYGSCTPDLVTIQVFVSGGDISSVVLFKQLKDQASGEATGWDEGTSMNPAGDGWFTRTITARSVDGADKVGSAWLLYQFVATGSSGQVAGRSQVYSDITLSACSAPVRPTIITITPTTGRIIIHPPTPTLIPLPR